MSIVVALVFGAVVLGVIGILVLIVVTANARTRGRGG